MAGFVTAELVFAENYSEDQDELALRLALPAPRKLQDSSVKHVSLCITPLLSQTRENDLVEVSVNRDEHESWRCSGRNVTRPLHLHERT